MARFHGAIGFLRTEETDPDNHPGVYQEVLRERHYYGDTYSSGRRWDQNGNFNDNLVVTNRISVVADDFAKANLGSMKFVRYLGDTWKIASAEIQYPRIILTLGGQYHEPEKS